MKFLADMGISPKTTAFLHARGYDATHLVEQGLERLIDPDIVTKARQEGRILLVHDLGFGELIAASGTRLPSVITFRLRNMHPERVNRCRALRTSEQRLENIALLDSHYLRITRPSNWHYVRIASNYLRIT
jgi:predicted nuclease of predicted toxin-antitoxin system